jgi:hypothetical protein
MSSEKQALVARELLQEPSAEGKMSALLINHTARLSTKLYVERTCLEKTFVCRLPADSNFLSIADCPVPKAIASVDWNTMWRALGAILRTAVQHNIDPIDNIDAIRMAHWILSGD